MKKAKFDFKKFQKGQILKKKKKEKGQIKAKFCSKICWNNKIQS